MEEAAKDGPRNLRIPEAIADVEAYKAKVTALKTRVHVGFKNKHQAYAEVVSYIINDRKAALENQEGECVAVTAALASAKTIYEKDPSSVASLGILIFGSMGKFSEFNVQILEYKYDAMRHLGEKEKELLG